METNLDINVFVPIVAELNALKTKADAVDLADPKAMKEVRLELKAKRVEVVKFCKDARQTANDFAKFVITKEKELVGIISPAEEKFKQIEAQEAHDKEMELRKAVLPERLAKIESLNDTESLEYQNPPNILEKKLLEMDGSAFQGYFNQRLADKNEADRAEIARVQAEQAEKEQALENEKIAREREETARKEERERIGREQIAKEKADKEQAEFKVKKEAEWQKQKDEQVIRDKAKRERADRYKAFRTEHGYTEETKAEYWEDVKGDTVTLYKKVGTFDLTKI